MEVKTFAHFSPNDMVFQIERARVEELEWALVNDGRNVSNEVRVPIPPTCNTAHARSYRMTLLGLEHYF